MRYTSLLVIIVSAASCSSARPAATPQPELAARTQLPRDSLGRMDLRAYCAAHPLEHADSINVSPGRIELPVGGRYNLAEMKVTRAGEAEVTGHVPTFIDLRSPVARIERGYLVAVSVGEAEARVRPLCRQAGGSTDAPPAILRVTVVP